MLLSKKMKILSLNILLLIFASSCSTSKRFVYFSDLKNTYHLSEEVKNNQVELRIQTDDLLSITVSSLNSESNTLFNNGVLPTFGASSGTTTSTRANEGYLVEKNGAINFPVLGTVNLAGLTKSEATEKLTNEIKKSVKNPIINLRIINFKVTVIGEVGRPSTYTIPNDRATLIEVLGLAGDLTAYGKRENILIIREQNNIRTIMRADLTSRNILNSPAYHLQQNDIVYVEPVSIRSLQTKAFPFYLQFVGLGISTLGLFLLLRK